MARKAVDHKDKKYHHITLLRPTRSGGAGVGVMWLGQCDCGKMKEYRATDVAHGRVKSCGSCEHHSALLKGRPPKNSTREAGLRAHLRRYINSALKRGIPWHLSPEQFAAITEQECTYCGAAPRGYKARVLGRRRRTTTTIMNGIDRVDSKKGYTQDNVVPCCSVCNRMKMALDVVDFIDQCEKITKRMQQARNLLDSTTTP